MRKGLLLIIAVFTAFVSFSQTTLISPTGDGGFENGSTLAANGWTGVSSVQSFFVGAATAASAGSNCAYTSTTSGSWTPGTSTSIAHIYKDITIPAGETVITVSLKYKTLALDAGYDYLKVHIVSTSTTPVGGTALATGQLGANTDGTTSYATYTFSGTVTAGTTQRLVISFVQDGYSPYGAAAIDEISVTSKAPVTYTWNATSGSASWATSTSWTPTRTTPDASDILQFNSGGSSTATGVTTQTVGRIIVSGNTTINLQSSATATLTIASDGTATDELNIANGSSLYLNSSAAALTLTYSGTGSTGTIAGLLELSSPSTFVNTFTATGGTTPVTTVTATGVLANGQNAGTGVSVITGSTATLIINGTYNHKFQVAGGTIPTATWGASSNTNIIGYTTNTAATGGITQNFANLTWNCTSQTAASVVTSSGTTGVSGTFTVSSTGSGSVVWGTTGAYIINANNFTQTGGTFNLANGVSGTSAVFNVTGTFNQSAGTLISGGTSTNVTTINFNGASTQSVTFAAQPTGPITYRFSNATGVTLNGSWGANFAIGNGTLGGLRISTSTANPITLGGTLTGFSFNAANSTLIYDAVGSYTARAQEFPASSGPANLTVAVGSGNVLTVPFSRSLSCATVNSVLTLTSGDIDLSSNTLTLGASASFPGTLTYTAGAIRLTTGTLTRWFGTSGLPTSAGIGVGYFPLAFGTNNRNVQVYGSAQFTTGGSITVGHSNAVGTSSVSVLDGTYTIEQQTNAYWAISSSGIATAASTMALKITGGGLVNTTGTNLRLMQNAAISGTQVASSGTTPNFAVTRTAMSVVNISQNQYIGAANADLGFISIATGNWEDGSTWNKGTAPTATDNPVVANGHTVTVNATPAVANTVTINAGGILAVSGSTLTTTTTLTNSGTLNVSGGTLTTTTSLTNNASSIITVSSSGIIAVTTTLSNSGTINANGGNINVTAASTTGITNNSGATFTVNGSTVNLGPIGGSNRTFSNSGTLTMSNGTINVNGNMVHNSGATFNQTGGDINIDGNAAGVAANSVLTGTNLLRINTNLLNLVGGKITIVDPHAGASTSDYAIGYSTSGLHYSCGTGHTVQFGDGISTDAGGHSNGFYNYLFVSTGYLSLGNVIVNSAAGTNRFVKTTSSIGILGNLTITNGEYQLASTTYVAGNIVNNGILTSTSTLNLATWSGGASSASNNSQSISGSGTFRNATSGSTASLTSLTVNNTNATGITLSVPLSLSGTLTMTAGLINTTSTNLLTLGTTTTGGTLSGSPSATNMIVGPFARTFGASLTAVGTFSTTTLLPVGKGTTYLPVYVDPTTTAGGAVVFTAESFTSNSGTLGTGATSLSTNTFQAIATSGAANLTNAFVRIADVSIASSNRILQAPTATGAYGSIAQANTYASGALSTISAIPAASYNGYFAYGDVIPCVAPTTQPTSLTLNATGQSTIAGSFTTASPAPTNYLIVRTTSSSLAALPVDATSYTVGANTYFGTGGYVESVGSATTISSTGLTSGTTYYYWIFSFNTGNCSGGPLYYTSSPLSGNATTGALFTSIASGNWEDGSTWNQSGAVPTSASDVVIAATHTVTVNAVSAAAAGVTVNSTGALTVSGNTLNINGTATGGLSNGGTLTVGGGTINLGYAGANNRTFTNSGILTVSSGNLNINGNFSLTSGGKLNQSGGTIAIDGNNAGSATGSVASGTYIFSLAPTSNTDVNLSGGTTVIVDPHYTTTQAIYITAPTAGAITATGTHTFQFGDGISNDNGGINGFYVYTWAGTGIMQFKNVVLASVTGGLNRFVYVNGTYYPFALSGDLTINSGAEFMHLNTVATTNPLAIGGNLVNNGTLTSTGNVYFGNAVSASSTTLTLSTSTAAQTISGSGTFRNLATSPTANFTSLTVNNTNTSGVTFAAGLTPTVSGTTTITAGSLNADALSLTGSTAQSVVLTAATSKINVQNFTLNNSTGATLSGSGFLNVTGTVDVTAGILASAGRLTLKSTATTNARVASVASGAISGSVNVERYFPGKRAYRFLGHPFNASIALSQLMTTNGANTGIDVTGTGGSTNGFTTTGTNNPSAFNYTPASGNSANNPDPGWNPIGSASATNWAAKQGLRVFVRGAKGEGLNGAAYTPSATTVTMSGTLNDGSSPVFTLSNGATSDYNLIANPLASTIDMRGLTLGGDVAGSTFYVWDVSQGATGAYVNEPFASAATYRYLPLGSAFFARSASGAGTITFPEAAKVSNTPAAILRGTSKYGNNSIQLVLNDNTGVKHDRVLFFFSKRAAEEKDNMDGEKMTNPGVNFYANSKDSKKLSIDVRPLTDNTIIPLTLNTPFDREFTITAEDFNVTDNKDVLLHDKKTDTYTKLSAGVSYSFTSTLSDATTYGNRFELITKVNPSLLVENILDIKLSPNPVKDVLTINYSTPNATLEATTIIKITNNVGQIIENLNLGASATGSQKINMSKYAKGVYTIELVVGKEKVVKQIVKQ